MKIFFNITLFTALISGFSFAQNNEFKIVKGGMVITKNAVLRESADSSSKIVGPIEIKSLFLIKEEKIIRNDNKVAVWYKVQLKNTKTYGWISNKDFAIGETDSISFANGNYSGLFYSLGCKLQHYEPDLKLAENLFKSIINQYPDEKIPLRDDISNLIILIDAKVNALKRLAEMHIHKNEFANTIELYNQIINNKSSCLNDILESEMNIINIHYKNRNDYRKTIELCHRIIVKYPGQELNYYESNYWVDIYATDIILKIYLETKNYDSLLIECKKVISETENPAVYFIGISGICRYYAHEANFDLLESILSDAFNKYPSAIRTYFKTDIDYKLMPIDLTTDYLIDEYGDYEKTIRLLKSLRSNSNEKSVTDHINYLIAKLLDNGEGDKEQIISAYEKVPKDYYFWDFISKREVFYSEIEKQVNQIQSYKNEKVTITKDAEFKNGLRSKSSDKRILIKGTEAEILYTNNEITSIDGQYGNWSKIKLKDGKTGWVHSAFLKALYPRYIFKKSLENVQIWSMEGASPERLSYMDAESIKDPELDMVIDNISSKEVVFTDINNDNILDVIAYSSKGLTAVDGSNQNIFWVFDCQNGSVPLVDKNMIYISAFKEGGHYIFALNKKDASVVWKNQLGNADFSGTPSSPAILNNLLFVGTRYHGVYAFNTETGKVVWQYPLSFPVMGCITRSLNLIYFVSREKFDDNDHIFAVEAYTGKLRWSFDFQSKCNYGYILGAALSKNKIFCSDAMNNLYGVNSNTGKLIWKTKIRTTGQYSSEYKPSVFQETVYYASPDMAVIALNCESGDVIWKYSYQNGFFGTPAIVNGSLYIGSMDGYIHAISMKNGELNWKYKIGQDAYGGDFSVSVSQSKIFISSTDNKIYVIEEKPTDF